MEKSSRNRTKKSEIQEFLKEDITLTITMDRESLLALSKALALASSLGVFPLEVSVFCAEVAASIGPQIGLNNMFSQMNPDEFWSNFFPNPKGFSRAEQKKQILKTFKKHRADWRKLWSVD